MAHGLQQHRSVTSQAVSPARNHDGSMAHGQNNRAVHIIRAMAVRRRRKWRMMLGRQHGTVLHPGHAGSTSRVRTAQMMCGGLGEVTLLPVLNFQTNLRRCRSHAQREYLWPYMR